MKGQSVISAIVRDSFDRDHGISAAVIQKVMNAVQALAEHSLNALLCASTSSHQIVVAEK